ncbi:hypothetical protein Lal_00012579 [Lupinus albus]|nr:hypothetical protein Lal_00012579 [Lupinus albus]
MIFFVGMQFESKEATLNAIKQFHIHNSFDYLVVQSMSDKYVGCCKHFGTGCEWKIHHTKLTSSFILNCIINLASEDLNIPIKALVEEFVSHFRYSVTYRKAWTTKQLAMR